MTAVSRGDIAKAVAKKLNMTFNKAEGVIIECFQQIKDRMVENEPVNVYGFGTFKPVVRAERVGRNPATGEALTIPETKTVRFVPSANFKSALN